MEAQLAGLPSVMCAGDDDQSIYSFRGARAGRAFAAFLADFPQAVAVGLPISYRLPGHLYVAAQEMIARNSPQPLLFRPASGPSSSSFPPATAAAAAPTTPETLLDYYALSSTSGGDANNGSSAAWGVQDTAAAATVAVVPPQIPPRDYRPRLPPGVELEKVQEATLSRISVQEAWDDMVRRACGFVVRCWACV